MVVMLHAEFDAPAIAGEQIFDARPGGWKAADQLGGLGRQPGRIVEVVRRVGDRDAEVVLFGVAHAAAQEQAVAEAA